MRNIFPAPKDMIVTAMNASTCARVIDDPARPPGQEMVYTGMGKEGYDGPRQATSPGGHDLEIRVTIHDEKYPWTSDDQVETPAEALKWYHKLIRDMTDEQLAFYQCSLLDGHDWEEVEK
jgi:hypothetical protein